MKNKKVFLFDLKKTLQKPVITRIFYQIISMKSETLNSFDILSVMLPKIISY